MIVYDKRNIRTWSLLGPSGAHGTAAVELAETDPRVLFLTADLCFFSGLERFKAAYPDRIYNVGIAEQNMLGIAGGLAKEGFVPFCNTYASFCASRCADQVRVNMSYMGLPIKLIGLTAGYGAGVLGATHASIEDVSLMRALPNITVISPADCTEIIKTILAAAKTPDPTYIRLTGPMNTPIVYKEDYKFEIGKAIYIKEGEDVCFIATGSMVYQTVQASKLLEKEGVSCGVINMHTIKPLDVDTVIVALGTGPNPIIQMSALADGLEFDVDRKGYFVVDAETRETSVSKIYAGGDVAPVGASNAINAMGAGKKAAKAINKYLSDHIVN